MAPESDQQMLEYQAAEMARLEYRANLYQNKLAAVKEMTNVFLVALMCFYAVWVPFLFFEVMEWPSATWTALSIACTLAVGLLMAYILSISSAHKQAVTDLYSRRMGYAAPVPQAPVERPPLIPLPEMPPPLTLTPAPAPPQRNEMGQYAPKVKRAKL
jgi:hypothetical protein